MTERYWETENVLYAKAQAIAFIGCEERYEDPEDRWGYSAIVFSKGKSEIFVQTLSALTPYRPELALYDATELVLQYCEENRIEKVDIFYDACEGQLAFSNANEDVWRFEEVRERALILEAQYPGMEVNFCKCEESFLDQEEILAMLRKQKTGTFMDRVNPIDAYIVLADKLAEGALINRLRRIKCDIDKVRTWKKVILEVSGPECVKEEGLTQEIAETPKQKTLLDLVEDYAKSICKSQMTIVHLLYGFACVCLMSEAELCKAMGREEGEEYTRVSYLKNELLLIFGEEIVQMDPVKLKLIIPKYIEDFERLEVAISDYEKAVQLIERWRYQIQMHDDFIAYGLLNKMMHDPQTFACNNVERGYLKMNAKFILDTKCEAWNRDADMKLGDIAYEFKSLYAALSEKIFGQDLAVQKFVQGYTNAVMDKKRRKNKPRASFLFAGPPGVGKTYLAQVAADKLGVPMRIFDMSAYSGHNSLEGLIGFEKTYRAAQPGVLTSYVNDNPGSIIIFDEIEKASDSVKMLFLQVLEGARLHDKYYDKDVSFENAIVIFTTNAGRALYEHNEDANLSALPESEVLDALREDVAFPKELCSRFASGNMIMFNHLQPKQLVDIVRNKMDEAIVGLQAEYGVEITYNSLLPEFFLFHMGSGADARVVSGRCIDWLNQNIVSLARNEIEQYNKVVSEKIMIDIDLDDENKEVYQLFMDDEECEILVVSDDPQFDFSHTKIHVNRVHNEDEMLACIREKKIALAVVDLNYLPKVTGAHSVTPLGNATVGNRCFEMLREKAPQMPVYVLKHETYHEEDERTLLNAGAKGLFDKVDNTKDCIVKLAEFIRAHHIYRNLKMLRRRGHLLDYSVRYVETKKQTVLEFNDLVLKKNDSGDVALRKMASQTQVFDFDRPQLRFTDIIGANQAKRELTHFINYIRNIERYVMEGADVPKGAILYGPPGTGKTSLAKAFAGECEAFFLNTTGADIRQSKDPVNEIKRLFRIAHSHAPAIIFIDEVDVIAKERNGHDTYGELIVNTLLTQMEGFEDKDPMKPVFVVAATNYSVERTSSNPMEVVLDPALVRRFDNPIYVGLPSREERKQYIQMILEQKKYSDRISEVAIDYMAEHTGGRSLAFLKRAISNMTNAAIDLKREISDDLLTDTLETQLYGEKREHDDENRLRVARHEVGHAYVAWMTKKTPKFITIVSRGNFGGYVSFGDGEDVHNLTKDDFLDNICFTLAGRAAEIVYYGERGINTGASSDLQKATRVAIEMICHLGMGNLGLLSLNPDRILESPKGTEVLEEANRILEEQMQRAIAFIKAGSYAIDRIVEVLMDKSYIQGENLISILEESEQTRTTSGKTGKKQKWYVVFVGRKPGIYTEWQACSEQVNGYTNALYRSYATEEEAKNAFRSSRVGVKNVKDKKLLYHLVRVSDVQKLLKSGMPVGTAFDFYANTPDTIAEQKLNSSDAYAYICLSREHAKELGCSILIGDKADANKSVYEYAEGETKIDWKRMERESEDENPAYSVQCVANRQLTCEDIGFIYVADEESACHIREWCRENTGEKSHHIFVNVNKRMFAL